MEPQILDLFLFNNKLKFSQINKKLKTRSNKLAYHIKNLVKKGLLEKENQYYKLSENTDYLIPYLSTKKAVLPVILIAIKKGKTFFLYKREKRPFKNKLSLPGGRLILGENISQATSRIMKEKFNINANFKQVNSISLEHVKKKGKIIHSFLLILVTASTNQLIPLIDANKNKSKIISSDYKLIRTQLNKQMEIDILVTRV